ncbi:MAG: HAD family hydrolase [Candidatus Edwardsbacteria bacterium]|nr:HAD family hydrolase [Candidatus Edwardsbacteria bacterium]MBU1577595.1 HAD family hydrolase [Candidatus Edwardsbacteria bacterium]MBU2464498.1 HAD family hydrolase [Candidatus Edwardsbacteria bacterium]MBU2595125.1 HAD family hydrolase [Candidatus Edwardsbacteria bacterium]
MDVLGNSNREKWVFLDVGNVIFYDLPLLARIWKYFYLTLKDGGLRLSFEEVLREREKLLESNSPEMNPRKMIADKFAGHIDREIVDRAVNQWQQVYPGSNYPVAGIKDVLKSLHGKYNLGIIANQPSLAMDELKKHRLEGYFKHIIISDVVGYHKPDPQIFRHAVDLVGAKPDQCLMVGDRIDNDVRPAKITGMRALWLNMDFRQMDYQPADNYEKLYIESYLRITGIDQSYEGSGYEPDAVIKNLEELPRAIESILAGQEVAG